MAEDERVVHRGMRAAYRWLSVGGDFYMGTLLKTCPEVVMGKFLAITSRDSGIREITEEERAAGWDLQREVAYSPMVTSVDSLEFQRDGLEFPGYDEWYVFPERKFLNEIFHGNPWEFDPKSGKTLVWVNLWGFTLHESDLSFASLRQIFWKQLKFIAPETYIADGRDWFTIFSKDETLIDTLHQRIDAGQ